MTRVSGLLDPESAAAVTAAVDAATSPRRGGPRFVKAEDIARAERIVNDERTTEQLALDALVDLIDVAVRGDSRHVLGARRPEVRVLVTKQDLENGVGPGRIDGQSAAISVASVMRLACDGGLVPILFEDDGGSLNLGNRKRLHNSRQRTVIAARDGGCIAPNCDRPPSWCEVHHIVPYSEGGRTDLADGVLLCRHHHMLVHKRLADPTNRERILALPTARHLDRTDIAALEEPGGATAAAVGVNYRCPSARSGRDARPAGCGLPRRAIPELSRRGRQRGNVRPKCPSSWVSSRDRG